MVFSMLPLRSFHVITKPSFLIFGEALSLPVIQSEIDLKLNHATDSHAVLVRDVQSDPQGKLDTLYGVKKMKLEKTEH